MTRAILYALFLLTAPTLHAQVGRSSDLYRTLMGKDSLLFDIGYNTRNISPFETLVSDTFTFYHDEAGPTESKQAFIDGIKHGLFSVGYIPRRELVPGSIEVFPLAHNGILYGAIQTGSHRFFAREGNGPEHITSVARFTHLWIIENGEWKLRSALSYDHRPGISTDTVIQQVDTLLFHDSSVTNAWLRAHHIPTLAIGYVKHGRIESTQVFGMLGPERQAPINTIFNVASLTKPITAVITLKLVSMGQWNLDEPLSHYWQDPDLAGDSRADKLTTRFVLSHRSGFPNWRRLHPDGKLGFEFEPGTKYQYSGEGFEYLRHALEHNFHTTLDQLADRLLFKPLQMNDTKFFWDSTIDESRFARWHTKDGRLYETERTTFANGADDLLTTIEDYSKFLTYVLGGAGLAPSVLDAMDSAHVQIKKDKFFGLGWWIDYLGSEGQVLAHGGDDIGVHTIAFMHKPTDQAIVIFTNCDNGTETYAPILRTFLGRLGECIIDVETR